ncbi:DinB family protein [Chitinophaga eiseniae]|uniref:DinB family protein n=1 Tax=Chitinophaga eiseniae TaxID=634771 RepID=A0A847S3W0_9BACT|nr:DinB family protein [Chitinophaga eiseniae]NLR77980.1 DinB family protein [Chitinophaga eiseniae]
MEQHILLLQLEQSQAQCLSTLQNIHTENASFRLSENTRSVGFNYRHIGETIHLLAQFLGVPTDVQGTTMGKPDTGQEYDLTTSKALFEKGYDILRKLVHTTSVNSWLEEIDTPWFGKIPRIRLYSIILFHNAHHCGQISSAIVNGKKY